MTPKTNNNSKTWWRLHGGGQLPQLQHRYYYHEWRVLRWHTKILSSSALPTIWCTRVAHHKYKFLKNQMVVEIVVKVQKDSNFSILSSHCTFPLLVLHLFDNFELPFGAKVAMSTCSTVFTTLWFPEISTWPTIDAMCYRAHWWQWRWKELRFQFWSQWNQVSCIFIGWFYHW